MRPTHSVIAAVLLATVGARGLAAAPAIGPLGITPTAITVNTPTAVTVTAVVTNASLIPGSVNVQRLNTTTRVFQTIGTLQDDGTNTGRFTIQVTFTEPAPFPVTLRVSAAFRGMLTRVFSPLSVVNVNGAAAPTLVITDPANLSFINTSPVTVRGTVSDPSATLTVNGIAAPASGGTFSVSLPLIEGNNTLTAVASANGSTQTASIQVTLDTTPPRVTIISPSNGVVTTDATVTVAGTVNDTVVGTVNDQQAQVTVNGHDALVRNRSFQAFDVALALGDNVITATARDRAGNGATTTINIRRDPPTQPHIQIVSGNNQSGPIGSTLPSPLVVALLDANDSPVANQSVVFTTTQNNGSLGGGQATTVVTTNAQGQAQVNLTMGLRSGAGNNTVLATANGFAGSAVFTASGLASAAALINMDAGTDQTGVAGQALPHPFVAVVTDAGHNRLGNVFVTFQVTQGGGSIGGQSSVTRLTDSDGRALASLTLGAQEGIANNIVEATFPGNTGFPAAFVASGRVQGDPAATRITGIVLDNSNIPVAGATLRAYQINVPAQVSQGLPANIAVQTDLQGQFVLQPAPVGFVKLIADGSTVQRPGQWPNLEYDLVTVAGQNNTIGMPIYLLPLDTAHQLCVSETTGGTLTLPQVPGFSLTVQPGTATFPGGSKAGCISVTPVHPDKIPMVPGFGQQPKFIVTIQPAGTLFNPPAAITMPNLESLSPREVTEMYSFDHDLGTFVSIGTATVSDDGTLVRSDPGVGVLKAGWHCDGYSSRTGSAGVCLECQICTGSNCVGDPNMNNQACSIGVCTNGACQPWEYSSDPAMHDTYSAPLIKQGIKVSAAEKMIFNIEAEDIDQKRRRSTVLWTQFDGVGPYKITLTITGQASWNSPGSGTKTLPFNSLFSGNALLWVDDNWDGTNGIAVKAKLEDIVGPIAAPDVGSVRDANFEIDWTLTKRTQCPTTMHTVAGATNTFRPSPADYIYEVGPALPPPATAPYYTNETILESFGDNTAYNFTMNDLSDAFKATHPTLTTANMVAEFFFPASNNGTFVVGTNGPDLIGDSHGRPNADAAMMAAFKPGVEFGFNRPQTYSCGGNDIQSYIITTKYVNGIPMISKTGP